jgi:hypothetical protein
MRYLHPVAASERFIAKGVYKFYRDDDLQPGHEAWTRHALAGGGVLTRVDRENNQFVTLAEVLADEAEEIIRLTVLQWSMYPKSPYGIVRANYFRFPNEVHATRTRGDQPMTEAIFPLAPEGYIHPPFKVFIGLAIGKANLRFRPRWNWDEEDEEIGYVDSRPRDLTKVDETPSILTYDLGTIRLIFDHHMILQEYHPPVNRHTILTEYSHV